MIAREQLVEELRRLSDEDVQRVTRFLAILKSKSHSKQIASLDENSLRIMYEEASGEDSLLADSGLSEYAAGLKREDKQ
ncbi:MAG: hypothetical protein HY961_13870 [Ignavibacteriae bacterium]|nr:hypothetical protein [Ignavibacteriota bacterium]